MWVPDCHSHANTAPCPLLSRQQILCGGFSVDVSLLVVRSEIFSHWPLSLCDLPVCVLCHFSNWVIVSLTGIFYCQLTWFLSVFIKLLLCSRFFPRGNLNFRIIRLRFYNSGSMFCWTSQFRVSSTLCTSSFSACLVTLLFSLLFAVRWHSNFFQRTKPCVSEVYRGLSCLLIWNATLSV